MTLRVLQAMAGAQHGGAEAFFTRLAISLHRAGLDQEVVVRPDPARVAKLRAAGLNPVEIGFRGPLDFVSRVRLARVLRSCRPHVALTWMSRATRAMPARRPGAYVHVGRLGGYYDLKYYRRCDHLIGNTPDIVEWLVRQGWPRARAHYLPNFVDAAPAAPVERAALATPSDAVVVLALGRLHANKAFDIAIDALARMPEAVLWLAGSGDLRRTLQDQARRLGVADRVRFLGWRDDVSALLAAADVFICPSRHEPLGNVVIEAWAQGKPVVAAASVGPAALIAHEETGLLVPVDDASALAAAVRRLAADRALAARLAAAGRAAYERRFTEAAVVQHYLDFFARVSRA